MPVVDRWRSKTALDPRLFDDRVHDAVVECLHVVTDQDAPGNEKSTSGTMSFTASRGGVRVGARSHTHEPDGAPKKSEGCEAVSAVSSQDVAKRVQWRERRVAAVGPSTRWRLRASYPPRHQVR